MMNVFPSTPLFAALAALVLCNPAAARAELRPWTEYRTIMWISDNAWKDPAKAALFREHLREMGINTGMVHGDGNLQPLLTNHLPYYVENMVNRGLCLKWNSNVRDWDKFVTEWAKDGRAESGLVRDYSLDDSEWQSWARREMQQLVKKSRANNPVAYDIRDELSTTISANPFDYDFSPATLTAFREWLKTQYASLQALNGDWQTGFRSWEEVKPFTTDQIKNRMASGDAIPRGKPDWQALARLRFNPAQARNEPTRWNFSPWADFRTYMDISLARTLNELRQATRELDPATPVGIEGTQMPHAFGGYDLWRLSGAIDWVEPYDIGNAREIFGSFMPGQPILCTVFEKETNPARRRLWHLLLEGDRGCIVWWSEDCFDWKSAGLELSPKGKALAPVLMEMTSPLARLFLNAERVRDPIFIHYSQPSIQVDWLLESTVDGPTWLRRFSSFEADHNRMVRVRNSWLKLFQDLGYSPRFLSSAEIETGALKGNRNAALVLPGSLALSDREAAEMEAFLKGQGRGGLIVGDGPAGVFDAHGKLRLQKPDFLPDVSTGTTVFAVRGGNSLLSTNDISRYAAERLKSEMSMEWPEWAQANLALPRPEVSVHAHARVRVHRFDVRRGRLLAFERNVNYHMSEDLKQAGGNEALEKEMKVEASLQGPGHVYDLRSLKYLGRTDRIRFVLSPWQPALFAVTREALQGDSILAELADKQEARLEAPPSLKSAADGFFEIGVGISDRIPWQTNDWPLLKAQFSTVTPENCMKPVAIQPAEGEFRFSRADAFVDFATQYRLNVVGHCLVWAKDDRTPPWFYLDGTNTASREVLLRRMREHIETVAGRYRGRIAAWDVVNEALDDGTNYLRPSGWSKACGEEFIAKAFHYAHASAPDALLIYNDYNNELTGKREKMLRLVRSLLEQKVPLHAVGLQGHYEIGKVPFEELEETLKALQALGMKVVVSELDIDVIPRSRWWADGGKHRAEMAKINPYQDGCPPEILKQQAEDYARLFRLFRKYSGTVARISFWNLHDGDSWLNYFPWRRANHPLLFDRAGRPKPAFDAVMQELRPPE